MGTALPILAGPSEGRGDTAPDPGLTLTPGLGDSAAPQLQMKAWDPETVAFKARQTSGQAWLGHFLAN